MSDNQKRFAKLFKDSGNVLTPEIKPLFDTILSEDFNDDGELMSEFMVSLQPEIQRISDPRQEQIDMLQETVLQLSELLMGGM